MTYKETLDWMFNKLPMYQRIGAAAYKADLNNTIQLLQLLDNPHHNFKSVHVAGTNGKGSTSHMLASVFQEAGYKTGLYTSPHLIDFRERIRINGEMIPEENVVQFIDTYKAKFEAMELSFFEMTVGMAFDYFSKEKIDIAIVEVGMGGRLDSTNLITPELSIITNIDFDHMKFLGDTRAKIAYEKAGIIKPNNPVVIGETHPETEQVFIDKAKECNSPIYFADQVFDCDKIHIESNTAQQFDVWKNSELYLEALEIPLMGYYQQKNLTTVMCALDLLRDKFNLTEDHIRDGIGKVISNTHLMGRWQILNSDPLTIADTGHNVAGITEVVQQFQKGFRHGLARHGLRIGQPCLPFCRQQCPFRRRCLRRRKQFHRCRGRVTEIFLPLPQNFNACQAKGSISSSVCSWSSSCRHVASTVLFPKASIWSKRIPLTLKEKSTKTKSRNRNCRLSSP